jgi:hypothetical protein
MKILLLTLLAFAALVPAANAANISYVGPDGNVWVASPDGTQRRQVTTDGTPDSSSSQRYRALSQSDDGTIVAARNNTWHVWAFDGTKKATYVQPGGGLSATAQDAHLDPAGTTIVFGYLHGTGMSGAWPRVTYQSTTAPNLGGCGTPWNCYDNVIRPRWVHGTAHAAWVDPSMTYIDVEGIGGWLGVTGEELRNFDVSRSGYKVLLGAGQADGPEKLYVWDNKGEAPPASANGQQVCEVASFAPEDARTRWSPDGSQIAWIGADGIYASPAPVADGNGVCVLQPKLVAPGGVEFEWGTQNVGDGSGGPSGGGDQGDRTAPAARAKLAGRLPRLRTALKKGIPFRVTTSEPGTVGIDLLAPKPKKKARKKGKGSVALAAAKTVRVARGSGRARKAGAVTVKVRFTKAGVRQLRRVRRVKLTARVVVRDAAGNQAVKHMRLTLRR